MTPKNPSTTATFQSATAGTYTVTASLPAIPAQTVNFTVVVHTADLLNLGPTPTGLAVLDLLGNFGSTSTALDTNGDGVVDASDIDLLLDLPWVD